MQDLPANLTSEQKLWASVIYRCYLDLMSSNDTLFGENVSDDSFCPFRFFFGQDDESESIRNSICSFAGLDGYVINSRVRIRYIKRFGEDVFSKMYESYC